LTEIIAVDPGKMTGLAAFRMTADALTLLASAECPEDDVIQTFRAWYTATKPVVVIERFVINARTVSNSQAPFSLEVIGAVKQVLRDNRTSVDTIVWQSPGDAKKMAPNDRLRRLGTWHVGGAGHANDAIRHGVLYAIRHGFKSRLLLPPE
jgi:hypothetical protein